MAENETTTADEAMTIPADRVMVALEATYEIGELNAQLGSIAENLEDDDDSVALMRTRLLTRGLTARIRQLNSIAMSVLGYDPGRKTEDMEEEVFGRRDIRRDEEATHHG